MKRKTIIGVIIISAIIGGVISTKVVSDNSKSNNIINVESKSGTSEAVNDNSEVVNDNSEVVNGNSEKVNDDSEVVNNNSEVVNNNSEKNKLDDGNKNSIEEDNKITSNAEYEIALNKAEEALNLGKFHKALDIINSINFKSDIDDLNWRMEHLKGNIEPSYL